MTIQTEAESDGSGILYEDTSGGYLALAITSGNYTSLHKLRVLPFDTAGTGLYTSPPSGTVSGIENDAENLASLVAGLYDGASAGAFVKAFQVLSDNTGVQPYPFSFGGSALFGAGTGGGAAWPGFVVGSLAGTGSDGSRWQLHFPGPSNAQFSVFGRFNYAGSGSGVQALMNYLTRASNGPVHAQKTGVVTHSGATIQAPMAALLATNKRLRRRYRVN
jgi:hypothetical protein